MPTTQTTPPAPRSYEPPTMTALGSIASLTAGDRSGTLDQLFGGNGGFQDPTDPTS